MNLLKTNVSKKKNSCRPVARLQKFNLFFSGWGLPPLLIFLMGSACSLHQNTGREKFEQDIASGNAAISGLLESSSLVPCDQAWDRAIADLDYFFQDSVNSVWRTLPEPPTLYVKRQEASADSGDCFTKDFGSSEEWQIFLQDFSAPRYY